MKHWFVQWLELRAADRFSEAQFYREAIKGETGEARNLLEAYEGEEGELLIEADQFEEVGLCYAEWGRLAENMIECGMEEQVIQYYDAIKSVDSLGLFLRPTKINWNFSSLGEMLRNEIATTCPGDRKDMLQKIFCTICELYDVGLPNHIIEYYQRKRSEYPELNLPEPIIHEEFDEEERATGRMKS